MRAWGARHAGKHSSLPRVRLSSRSLCASALPLLSLLSLLSLLPSCGRAACRRWACCAEGGGGEALLCSGVTTAAATAVTAALLQPVVVNLHLLANVSVVACSRPCQHTAVVMPTARDPKPRLGCAAGLCHACSRHCLCVCGAEAWLVPAPAPTHQQCAAAETPARGLAGSVPPCLHGSSNGGIHTRVTLMVPLTS